MRLAFALAFASCAPGSAYALVVPDGSSGDIRIHGARVVVHETSWVVSFRVSGSGDASLRFDEPGARLAPELSAALAEIDHATAPRFQERPPVDPCAVDDDGFGKMPRRHRDEPWKLGPLALHEGWPRPDGESLRGVLRSAPNGTRLQVRVTGRPSWTPPVAFERTGPLDLGPWLELAPPSREQRVDLFLFGRGLGLAPTGPIVDAPGLISLPELAFEQPQDTEAAIVRQRRMSAGEPAVRLFTDPADDALPRTVLGALGVGAGARLARFALIQGPGPRPPVSFTVPGVEDAIPLAPVFIIHRPFRGEIECNRRREYLGSVFRQQQLAHRIWSTVTGRRMDVLLQLSQERGYLLTSVEGLRQVEVDRSAWGRPARPARRAGKR